MATSLDQLGHAGGKASRLKNEDSKQIRVKESVLLSKEEL